MVRPIEAYSIIHEIETGLSEVTTVRLPPAADPILGAVENLEVDEELLLPDRDAEEISRYCIIYCR